MAGNMAKYFAIIFETKRPIKDYRVSGNLKIIYLKIAKF